MITILIEVNHKLIVRNYRRFLEYIDEVALRTWVEYIRGTIIRAWRKFLKYCCCISGYFFGRVSSHSFHRVLHRHRVSSRFPHTVQSSLRVL